MSLKPPTDADKVPTTQEFIAAVKKNNYPQISYSLFEIKIVDDTPKVYACAAGQGLLNLGLITEEELLEVYKEVATLEEEDDNSDTSPYMSIVNIESAWNAWLEYNFAQVYHDIWARNDKEHMTPQEIGAELERIYNL